MVQGNNLQLETFFVTSCFLAGQKSPTCWVPAAPAAREPLPGSGPFRAPFFRRFSRPGTPGPQQIDDLRPVQNHMLNTLV